MTRPAVLLFVYNADSGLFNLVADIGHKLFSPTTYPCRLCALTHGYLKERDSWRRFVESLPCACRFLHRDQFHAEYPDIEVALPALLRLDAEGPHCCADALAIARCTDLAELQALVTDCCPGEARSA